MSFYTSLNGLKNAQTDLGVIANNIANAETNGFKKSTVEFADVVVSSAATDPRMVTGIGARVHSINQDFSLGSIDQTGASLDVAISGDGFFTMRSALGTQSLYTRDGSFTMDSNGFVTDSDGNVLQAFPTDASGAITSTTPADAKIALTNGAGADFTGVTVGADGTITASYSDGSVAAMGSIALAGFPTPGGLKQVGSSNWVSTGISGVASHGTPGTGQYGPLLSGAVERSNVDLAEELVGLITAQRNFQANAKAIDTNTQIGDTVINLRS